MKIPCVKYGIFFVRLNILDVEIKVESKNLYIFSQESKHIFSGLVNINDGKLEIKKLIEGYSIKNIGTEVCCFVHGKTKIQQEALYINNNFESLFLGEEGLFKV